MALFHFGPLVFRKFEIDRLQERKLQPRVNDDDEAKCNILHT